LKAQLVPARIVEQEVQITMSREEAQFIIDVIGGAVVGDGRRKFADEIYGVLSGLGFDTTPLENRDFKGQVMFS